MRPENVTRLARIKRISTIFRGICTMYLVLCVVGFLVQTRSLVTSRCQTEGVVHCVYPQYLNGLEFNVSEVTDHELVTNFERVVFGCLLALGYCVRFNCGYQLHRLLSNYSRGDIFTTESAVRIRKWGVACVLLGVFGQGLKLVPNLLANAHTQQDGEGLSQVGIGLAIVAISWLMEMAAEMREEQDLVI